jgi:hypothetical protein
LEEFERGIDDIMPDCESFREQRFKFWREAWVAARFTRLTANVSAKLRLTPDSADWGDFELQDEGGRHVYEIAEALDPTMPPAFKRLRAEGTNILHESEHAASGEMARATIPDLITKKAGKNYPAGTGLLIYVNLWTYFSQNDLPQLVPKIAHGFRSIWILDSKGASQIFPEVRVAANLQPRDAKGRAQWTKSTSGAWPICWEGMRRRSCFPASRRADALLGRAIQTASLNGCQANAPRRFSGKAAGRRGIELAREAALQAPVFRMTCYHPPASAKPLS